MMISPSSYIQRVEGKSYPELIRERDRLVRLIRAFEMKEKAGDRSDPDWQCCPRPDVQYQMHLEYLSALCHFMHEKYNREYVWGDRSLKQDAEQG